MTTTTSRSSLTTALRVTTVIAVLNLAWQFVTAGEILPNGGPLLAAHAVGAIVLHVTTGLAALAAIAHWRLARGPLWPSVLAVVVFVLSFVQAYVGDYGPLAVHVPGAIVLTVGAVWLTAWAWMKAA